MINKKHLRRVYLALVLCAVAVMFGGSPEAFAQTLSAGAGGPITKNHAQELKLTPEEERLVRDSRTAIIETGFSPRYFDAHFKPIKVHNSPGDRRVVWRFRLNEYETIINDSIGFYTAERGRRVDTHMVAATLGKTRDIRRTISFSRAQRLMKACIGEYSAGSILLQPMNADGRTSFFYSAVSLHPPAERVHPTPRPTPAPPAGVRPDGPRPAGKKKPFLSIGSIDLENGHCLKGVAQAGSPQPTQPTPPPTPRPTSSKTPPSSRRPKQ